MHPATLETLALFLAERPELIDVQSRLGCVRAVAHPLLLGLKSRGIKCFQSFRLEFERLQGLGFECAPYLAGEFDALIYLPTGQRDENFLNYARCIEALTPGGVLLCSMHNELGAARFAKRLQELMVEVESYSKSHCRVFWGVKREHLDRALLKEWLELGEAKPVPGLELLTQPGIFGWNKIDQGSQLLVSHMPERMEGSGADLGCGYGYLSDFALRKVKGISALHLYEAEKLALDMAERNLAGKFDAQLSFEWHDVPNGLRHTALDWIIMNPPFHAGKTPAMGLGQRFIKSAADALRRGGELYMVANAQLPYPEVLKQAFSAHQILAAERGFRVYRAIR